MSHNYLKNNNANEFDDNSSVLVKPSDPILKRPPLYHVVLLNDDYTPMEFVIYVLQSFFGFDKEKATQIMLSVHTKAKAYVEFLLEKWPRQNQCTLTILPNKMNTL